MKTPLNDAVNSYIEKTKARFHTPAHGGVMAEPFSQIAKYDVTELEGLDDLYNANGAIREMEKGFEEIYGSSSCLFSAGGSTLCIQAMIALAIPLGGKMIVSRDVHTSVVNTMALLDIEPVWAFTKPSDDTGLMTPVTPKEIEALLEKNPDAAAVFVTSPNYYGVDCDVKGISAVCREKGKLLLVDSAHGAHYKFYRDSKFALDLGANLCCVSLHKTLPTMTGAALLHMDSTFSYRAGKKRMALFGSTSPSYPIMLSADALLPYLESQVVKDMEKINIQLELLKKQLERMGYKIPRECTDPARLTVGFGSLGYSRKGFLALLEQKGIEAEYTDDYYGIFIFSPNHTVEDWKNLVEFFRSLKSKGSRRVEALPWPQPKKSVSIREAVFAKSHRVSILVARGMVAGAVVAPCPPGIPLLIPGEEIDRGVIDMLKKHGILWINVL